MILTYIPSTPGFKVTVANPSFTCLMEGSPHFLMYPSWNFAQADLDPLILPEIVISTPCAPAFIILLMFAYATLLNCIPLCNIDTHLCAMILGFNSGTLTSLTSTCGFSKSKLF